LGITYLYATNFNEAAYQFLKVESFTENPVLKRKSFFYLTLCYALNYQWKDAEESFNNLVSMMTEDEKKELEHIIIEVENSIKEAKNFKYRSPEVAKWLSIFIFGAGQLYAGDYGSGLNAFALNGLIVYLIVDCTLKGNYLDAIFIALSFLERYYSGNIYHAEEKAKQYNEVNNRRFMVNLLDKIAKLKISF